MKNLVEITEEVIKEMNLTDVEIVNNHSFCSELDGSRTETVVLEYAGTENNWESFEPGKIGKEIVEKAYSDIVSNFQEDTTPVITQENGLIIYRTLQRGCSVIAQESDYNLYVTVLVGLD